MKAKTIELTTGLVPYQYSIPIDSPPYSCRLVTSDNDPEVILQVFQPFKDGSRGMVGSWYLSTLLESEINADYIWLDGGQQWAVKGIKAAIREALKHVTISARFRA